MNGRAAQDVNPHSHREGHDQLRILQVIGQLSRGGREFQMVQLVRGLRNRGADVRVIAFFGGPWQPVLADEMNVPLEIVRPHLVRIPALHARCRKWRPHVIHSHLPTANFYCRIAGRFAKVPAVIAQEGNDGTEKSWVRHRLDQFFAGWSHRVIANSKRGAKGYVAHGIPQSLMRVVYNGLDVESISKTDRQAARTLLPFGSDHLLIGVVARLTAQKNHDLLLNAMTHLIARYPKIRLIIVGGGELREQLEQQVALLGLGEHVHFTGDVSQAYRYMAGFDVFVVSSVREGMCNALAEAMLVGAPAVVTDVGGNAELIEHEKRGLVVPSGDCPALVAAISQMLDNPGQARQWAQAANEHARKYFSIDALTDNVLAVYKEVLEPQGLWQSE